MFEGIYVTVHVIKGILKRSGTYEITNVIIFSMQEFYKFCLRQPVTSNSACIYYQLAELGTCYFFQEELSLNLYFFTIVWGWGDDLVVVLLLQHHSPFVYLPDGLKFENTNCSLVRYFFPKSLKMGFLFVCYC